MNTLNYKFGEVAINVVGRDLYLFSQAERMASSFGPMPVFELQRMSCGHGLGNSQYESSSALQSACP